MNAEATDSSPDTTLADLRHRLRTPLNHIVGYSELLLGELTERLEVARELRRVCDTAQSVLGQIQQWLAPEAGGSGRERIARLRAEIEAPVTAMIGTLGSLAGQFHGAALLDLLRIHVAAMSLLSFSQGLEEPEKDESRDGSADRRAQKQNRRARQSSARQGAESAPARILVVDDDDANIDVVSRQLVRFGHTPISAGSGEAALRILEEQSFDLVLLDVMMPGMSGIEVLEEIKSSAQLSDTPVMMISALDELEGAARSIEMGAEDYLLKPVDPVLLRARVNSALERKRLHEAGKDRTRELEKASHDLQRANKDLYSFAFAASHDLQEPLRTIASTLQLLDRHLEKQLTPEQRELIQLAIGGASRMRNLISDLLSYSLANSRDRELENVALESAMDEAVTNLRQAIDESGASVTRTGLPPVMGDRAQIVQLFQNLIGNAIKYRSDRQPEVRVRSEKRAGQWIVSVEDNGIGIEEQYLRAIFQPFRRLHGRNLPGTGLGLAICERIVEGFGGRIWVESKAGAGSTFHFTMADSDSIKGQQDSYDIA